MSPDSKKEYMETIYLRYKKATKRTEKSALIPELCLACSWHRKHAIRAFKKFKRFTKQKQKKCGVPPKYNKPSITEPLKRIWLAANLPCSKRLKVIISLWIPGYCPLEIDIIKALLRK